MMTRDNTFQFQFQTGAIKSEELANVDIAVAESFNSKLVRLKVNLRDFYKVFAFCTFQFQTGAIKRGFR